MPGSPALLIPVHMDLSPNDINSFHPLGNVVPKTSRDNAGNKTIAPLVNITNNHGAHIPENSDTALKPYKAMDTTTRPTQKTMTTNHILVGYQLSCAGMSKAKRTAVADTVIIAADITEKIMTLAQL